MQPRTPVCRFTSNRVYYRRRQLLVVFSVGVGRRWWWQPGGGQRWQWRRPVVSRCWIFAKSAWEHNETHDKRLCPADTSAFVVPASQRLRKKSAAARCAERQSPWFCACSSFLLANYSQAYFVLSMQSSVSVTFWLPHVRPICNFAVQQSLRLCRPFYFKAYLQLRSAAVTTPMSTFLFRPICKQNWGGICVMF